MGGGGEIEGVPVLALPWRRGRRVRPRLDRHRIARAARAARAMVCGAAPARPARRARRRLLENRTATSAQRTTRFVENAAEVYTRARRDDACRGQRGEGGAGDALCARRATGPLCMRCQRGHHRVVAWNGRARCKRCGDWRSIAGVYVYLVVFVGLAVIWLAWARKALASVRTLADRLTS